MITVYLITNLASDKCYVGQTRQSIQRRWLHHCGSARSGAMECPALHRAIRKYGEKTFLIQSLREFSTQQEADNFETSCITLLGLNSSEIHHGRGYNLNSGGRYRVPVSALTRKRLSQSQRGRIPSAETREKMRMAKLGKKQNPEQVAKRNAINTGRKRTPEQRLRISMARMGKGCGPRHPVSDETRAKMRVAASLREKIKREERENSHRQ